MQQRRLPFLTDKGNVRKQLAVDHLSQVPDQRAFGDVAAHQVNTESSRSSKKKGVVKKRAKTENVDSKKKKKRHNLSTANQEKYYKRTEKESEK